MNHEQLALIGPILTQKIETTFPQIAVDSGIQFASDPILWVGDGDSGPTSSLVPLVMKPTQNETDLRFCLNNIESWNWNRLHLFGFLGKRKDHELANLGEVCQAIVKRTNGSMAIFYNESLLPEIYLYPSGTHSCLVDGVFSVLSFENCTMSISGECQFTIFNQRVGILSGLGVSNLGHGAVQIQSTSAFMVIMSGNQK